MPLVYTIQHRTKSCIFFYLFYTVQDLISKWRSVRDNYVRSLKKQAECSKSGSGRKKIQRYIFEEQLSFLKKGRELRPTTSSIQSDINYEDADATQLTDAVAIDDESLTDHISNAEKTVLTPPPTKKKKIDLEEKLALFLDSRQQSNKEQNRDTDDEDLNFYKSTLPLVKTLNMDQKIQFRIQLMQLLQRIKLTTNNAPPYFQPPGPIFNPNSGVPISNLNNCYNTSMPVYPSTIQHPPMYNHDELAKTSTVQTISPLSSNSSVTGYFSQFSPDEQNFASNTSTSSMQISNDTQADV